MEVNYNGEWGAVCYYDWWYSTNTYVVCKQLGFGTYGSTYYTYFGQVSGPIWLDGVKCIGNESALVRCGHTGFTRSCRNNEVVGVRCYGTQGM